MSSAFIALSHGSRHPEAARGIDKLVARTAELTGATGQAAHLEFNSPSLIDTSLRLREQGFDQVTLMPLLFTEGFHMRYDVPNVMEKARRVSGIELHPTPGLGTGSELLKILETQLERDLAVEENPHVILYAVGSSNAQANESIVRLGVRLADATGLQTSTLFATPGAGKAGYLWGSKGLRLQATAHPRIHVVPLFVTQGLLLDSINESIPNMMQLTGSHITSSRPLGTLLSEVLANRHHQSLRATAALSA